MPGINPYPVEQISTPRGASEMTGVSVTAGVAHTKGAYAELVASLDNDCRFIRLLPIGSRQGNSVDAAALMDFAVGSAGNEVIVLPNVGVGGINNSISGASQFSLELPIFIPSGTRVSARIQTLTASRVMEFYLDVYSGLPGRQFAQGFEIGANEATSKGVNVVNATQDVKGAWTELIASTPEIMNAFIVGISGDAGQQDAQHSYDIGVGAGGSEVVLLADFPLHEDGNEYYVWPMNPYVELGFNVPAGTRIACRMSSNKSTGSVNAHVCLTGLRI